MAARFLTTEQAARRLQVAPNTVLRFIRDGELRAANIGGGAKPRYRISVEDLEAWIDSRAGVPKRNGAARETPT